MTVSEYTLKGNFRAPAVNLQPGDRMTYKSYAAGAKVKGYVLENDDPNVALTDVPIIITTDNTAIPLNLITKIRDVEIDGKVVDIPAPIPVETAQSPQSGTSVLDGGKKIPGRYQEELNKIKQKYVVANVVKKSGNSVNGMIVGAIAGLIFSAIFKKPGFISMMVGTVAGGVIGNTFTKDVNANDIKNKTKAPIPEPKTA